MGVHVACLSDRSAHKCTPGRRADYHFDVWIAIGGYVVGVLVALWRTDAAWPIRTAVALLWPIGPAAFILTVLLLLAASTIAFPVVGALVAVSALLAAWWVL